MSRWSGVLNMSTTSRACRARGIPNLENETTNGKTGAHSSRLPAADVTRKSQTSSYNVTRKLATSYGLATKKLRGKSHGI